MQPLNNFSPCSRLPWIALTASAIAAAPGADLNYKVMLNGSTPIPDAYVTLQTPGGIRTIVTKTDALGKFTAPGILADKVLVTIEKNGSLVYRGIKGVDSLPTEKIIDLTAIGTDAPKRPAPAPKSGLAKGNATVFKSQVTKGPATDSKSAVAKQ